MPFPEYTPIVPNFVRHIADAYGDAELIVLDRRRLSFAEADAQSVALARGLVAAGVGKGTRVGLLMPNGPDWLIVMLAALRIGALLVPINTFSKGRELAWILKHADVDTLLTVSRFLNHDYPEILEAAVPELAAHDVGPLRLVELPFLRSVYVWGACEKPWARDHSELLEAGVEPELLAAMETCVSAADPAVIIYSSGSTADPKGAIHSQGTLIRHSFNLASQRDLLPSDRIWSAMPFFWVGGLVFSVLGNMHVGATTLCEEVFDPESTLAFLEREKVTIALGWPHFGKALAEHPTFASRDLSSLRAGNVPDILPEHIVHPDPSRRRNALGMTESCGPHTWDSGEGPLPEDRRGAFGYSVEGVEHRVVDPDSGEILEPGQLGEICLRGYSLMQGLYKHEREDVFEPDGFYRTGDAGYFDAKGELYFKGRLGEMIKSGGANVTPSEVEAVLLTFEEVKQAHVVGVDDPERGQTVEAAVVLELGDHIEGDALRVRLKQELSAYKVPRHVFVYPDGVLPFTDSGKIDKRKLASMLDVRLKA